jgi:acyl carrier protein
MGLDTVELVMKVERHLAIEIPDVEAARLVTVGDFHVYILEVLRRQKRLDGNADGIYAQLRDIICRQLRVEPDEIIPSARFLDDLGAD